METNCYEIDDSNKQKRPANEVLTGSNKISRLTGSEDK